MVTLDPENSDQFLHSEGELSEDELRAMYTSQIKKAFEEFEDEIYKIKEPVSEDLLTREQ